MIIICGMYSSNKFKLHKHKKVGHWNIFFYKFQLIDSSQTHVFGYHKI